MLRQVKLERSAAEQQREAVQDRLECTVCMEAERGVMFLPCSHVVACVGCAAQLDECPVCRAAIEQKLQMKLS